MAYHATDRGRRLAPYLHFTRSEPGVFLIGGLGIDVSVYRWLSASERVALSRRGSLAFAYTGDTRSRRDAEALGFERAGGEYLFVQWHDAPEDGRLASVQRVQRLGAF